MSELPPSGGGFDACPAMLIAGGCRCSSFAGPAFHHIGSHLGCGCLVMGLARSLFVV
jgi:hypothetical protein